MCRNDHMPGFDSQLDILNRNIYSYYLFDENLLTITDVHRSQTLVKFEEVLEIIMWYLREELNPMTCFCWVYLKF